MINTGNRKKVLIVSFMFPPFASIGALRVGKFAKYLSEFGWEPIILTANIDERQPQASPVEIDEVNVVRAPFFSIDSTFYQALGGEVLLSPRPPSKCYSLGKTAHRVIRLARPIYTLSIVQPLINDPIGWYPHALRKGKEILSTHKVDAIFSSYGPSTSHFVASRLQHQTGLPWVADFRDLWSLNHNSRTIKPLRFLERQMEKRVLINSSLLITVSEPLAQQLQALHGKKTVVIPNGFDEDDYLEDVLPASKFIITYTGNIYPGKQDPTPLFEAVRDLKESGKISPENFEIRFFGSSLNTLPPLIGKYRLGDVVKVCGFIPLQESIIKQKESTILLFLEWTDPLVKGVYTGKIFEYIGARRPVLAIAYDDYKGGVVEELLLESGTGILVSEVEPIKNILCKWLEEWQQSGKIVSHWKPAGNVIKRFTRKRQTQKLAQLLERQI